MLDAAVHVMGTNLTNRCTVGPRCRLTAMGCYDSLLLICGLTILPTAPARFIHFFLFAISHAANLPPATVAVVYGEAFQLTILNLPFTNDC